MQFVDEARRALEAADREDQGGAAAAAAQKADPSGRMLRAFLEAFISEEFLPEVYVNYRRALFFFLSPQNCCNANTHIYITTPIATVKTLCEQS